MCAGSVLALHDYITNVQKRLGNSAWVGGGQCRCCGLFLDPQLGHAENLQHRRSHAGALRVCSCRSLWHETGRPWHYHGTQGLTASQSRLADILTTAAVTGRSAWRPPLQRQPAEMLHRRHCTGSPPHFAQKEKKKKQKKGKK